MRREKNPKEWQKGILYLGSLVAERKTYAIPQDMMESSIRLIGSDEDIGGLLASAPPKRHKLAKSALWQLCGRRRRRCWFSRLRWTRMLITSYFAQQNRGSIHSGIHILSCAWLMINSL